MVLTYNFSDIIRGAQSSIQYTSTVTQEYRELLTKTILDSNFRPSYCVVKIICPIHREYLTSVTKDEIHFNTDRYYPHEKTYSIIIVAGF
jgi:hypothetical protein